MKFNSPLKIIVFLILMFNELLSQELYIFKLYNNKFEAVFPQEPTVQKMPKEYFDPKKIENSMPLEYKNKLSKVEIEKVIADFISNNIETYAYYDDINYILYSSSSFDSQLEHKNYIYSDIQKILDDNLKHAINIEHQNLLEFSSKIDKNNDTYIAHYTTSILKNGQIYYISSKQIYYKDKVYKWNMTYPDYAQKKIFDKYEQYCKITY